MKIYYKYKQYEEFPNATEISKRRELLGVLISSMITICLFLAILLFSTDDWLSSLVIIVSLSSALYYMLNIYPKNTEKKIQKEIRESFERKIRIETTRYQCKKITVSDKQIIGTCKNCFKSNRQLTFCEINMDSMTRELYLCDDCLQKFKSGITEANLHSQSNPKKTVPSSDENIAKSICEKLWESTYLFMEATQVPKTLLESTFFWSAFYYSIYEILKENNLNKRILQEFVVSASRTFQIPTYEVERLAALNQFRDATIKHFIDADINICRPEGSRTALNLALAVRFSDSTPPEEAKPMPQDTIELMIAALDVTTYTCKLLSKTKSSNNAAVDYPPKTKEAPPQQKAEANAPKNYTPIIIAAFLIAIFIRAFSVLPWVSESPLPQNSVPVTAAEYSQETLPAEQPTPNSGEILRAPEGKLLAPLEIRCIKSVYNMYFRLESKTDPKNNMSVFVHSGEETLIKVPLGEYTVQCIYGEKWYGLDYLFGGDMKKITFSDTLRFTESESGYHGYTVTLSLPGPSSAASPTYKPVPVIRTSGNMMIRTTGRPESGTILSGYDQPYGSQLTINASKGRSCVVSLKSPYGANRLTFFVRAGESVTVGVPREKMQVYFASGSAWFGLGEGLMFGQDTVYTKDDEFLDFTNHSWEYTLYTVTGGNFQETPSNENEFF